MSAPFDDRCPVFRAMSVVGEKWTLMILRDLFIEKSRRFQDFDYAKTGISPNVLSARLKHLEAEGIIERRIYSEHPPRFEYVLTAKGKTLGPVLKAMHDWGQSHPPSGSVAK